MRKLGFRVNIDGDLYEGYNYRTPADAVFAAMLKHDNDFYMRQRMHDPALVDQTRPATRPRLTITVKRTSVNYSKMRAVPNWTGDQP